METYSKPKWLKESQCHCVSDNDEECIANINDLGSAAEIAAETFYNNGDYPEEQIIHVERGDGEKRRFLVRTKMSPTFYAEEIK